MGHAGDDVVCNRPHKIKILWQNQLKSLVYFKVLHRIRYKRIDAILVQCPFNALLTGWIDMMSTVGF